MKGQAITSETISSRILRHLGSRSYRPERVERLAKSMGIVEHEYGEFRSAVKALMRAGRVVLGSKDCVMLPEAAGQLLGSFRGHPRGFGFVVPESPTDHGDLFVPPGATRGAMTGDTVLARITRRGKRGDESRVEGEVVDILERGQSRFVGELVREDARWMLIPDGKLLFVPVLLGDVSASRARTGDQVVVELTQYASPERPARGVIVEVLGRRGDPGIDTLSILRQYHFRHEFSEEVLADARRVIREHDLDRELAAREDLRHEIIVTIDPDDAKDFDDAISIRRTRGGYELGVHIADVSAFVQEGRPLDAEARQRGNSIYFPGHVVPMLPEQLSNGLCSLQEGEPRLTKSVFIEYDRKGRRLSKRYANTVIQSRKRLTYNGATAILEGRDRQVDKEVAALLGEMDRLARIIQKRRLAAGMIVLDIPEVELVLDDNNEVTGVAPTDTSFSHTIIEMFMVEANEAVAELLTSLRTPHLRRIHPEPPAEAQFKLQRFLQMLGKSAPKQLGRFDLIRVLDSVRGQPESFAVNLSVLRSMSPAEYSPKMIGHFALASEHYAHFTSPIRRYPDLSIHRQLDSYLRGEGRRRPSRRSAATTETLQELGKHCTFTERRAEDAERELKQVKILRFLERHLGDIEEGLVTGVTNVGLFVQLSKYLIDGLVRFDELPDDWWQINAQGGYVVGQRSGKRIRIGDRLKVKIAAVNLPARELNLAAGDDWAAVGRKDKAAKRGHAEKKPRGSRGSRQVITERRRPGRRQRAR